MNRGKTMQKQMKNGIIFVVFLLLCFLLTLTPLVSEQSLFLTKDLNRSDFDGLIFDEPANIDHLQITRRLEGSDPILYRYDVKFHYEGSPSNLRILGKVAEPVFFPEGTSPSKSKVVLKGEYEKINSAVKESLQLNKILEKLGYKLQPASELRVPLDENTEDYVFSVITKPATVAVRSGRTLADVGVFITNGKMDKFTDALDVKDKGVKPQITTKTQSGTYINSLELIDSGVQSRLTLLRSISVIICAASALCGLLIIFTNRKKLLPGIYGAMMLFLLALPKAMLKSPNNWATFVAFPLFAFGGYILFKLMQRPNFQVKSVDFRQGVGMAILIFVISTYLFAVTKGFYL